MLQSPMLSGRVLCRFIGCRLTCNLFDIFFMAIEGILLLATLGDNILYQGFTGSQYVEP